MEKPNNKKSIQALLSFVLKLSFTTLALWIVFSQVSLQSVLNTLSKVNFLYLLLAFVFFNLSKIISSFRLNLYFKSLGIALSEAEALTLYYIGMFYNLLLPGGIGGDGYKIYLLKRANSKVKTASLLSATLLDRLSGLVPLLILSAILYYMSSYYTLVLWLDWLVFIGLVLILPLFYGVSRLLFKAYMPIFTQTLLLGFLVQVLQLLSIVFILFSLSQSAYMAEYLVLFLLSSLLAVLPLSVGGIGIRELTFLYGLGILGLNSEVGVATAMLFFLITALSSFVGNFLKRPTV